MGVVGGHRSESEVGVAWQSEVYHHYDALRGKDTHASDLSLLCYQSAQAVPADGAALKRACSPRQQCNGRSFTRARLGAAIIKCYLDDARPSGRNDPRFARNGMSLRSTP